MLSARRTATAAVSTIVVATLAACSAQASPSEDALSLGPQLTVTFDLSGATTLKGTQTAAAPALTATFLKDCAEYARGSEQDDGKTIFAVAGLLDGDVDGHKVTAELWVDDYAGPGTYPKDQLAAPGSEPSIAVDDVVYATWPDSTASEVTTDGDGGGTWTFRKLAATGPGGLPADPVSGSLTWTCRDS
jgi:hypothetical protein